jgi:hypothetical protein
MGQPEEKPSQDPDPKRQDDLIPLDAVFELEEGEVDTTVRPSRNPQRYPVTKEELAEAFAKKDLDQVFIADGPEDTTVRPRDPNVPICWPEGVPMPWKTKQPPPPEPPKTE